MEAIEITVEERALSGSSAGRRMRRAGHVPAVVYSEGKAAQMITIEELEYTRHLSGRGSGQLFRFKSNSKSLVGQLALVKDIQIEPIKDKVLHLDFIAVDATKPIRVTVPLETSGESAVIKAGEAVLNMSVHELDIECLPTNIPSAVYVDISSLTLGKSFHASDVKLPEGVKLKSDPEMTIVSAVMRRAEEVAAPTAAPAEGAAAAAPAAGAAAAAPAAEKGKAAPAAKK